MAIGNLGNNIVFEVSQDKILTFKNLKRTISGKWQKHEIILRKAKQEFMGAELQSISFSVDLNAGLGIKPTEIINNLKDIIEKGKPQILVIGGMPIGDDMWVVTSMSEAWNTVLSGGQLFSATLELTLEEYLGEKYYG